MGLLTISFHIPAPSNNNNLEKGDLVDVDGIEKTPYVVSPSFLINISSMVAAIVEEDTATKENFPIDLDTLLRPVSRSLKDREIVKKSLAFTLLENMPKAKFMIFMSLASIKAAIMFPLSKLLAKEYESSEEREHEILSLPRIRENEMVIRYFFPDGGATLTDIVELTGLSPSTVKLYLDELVEENLVEKRGRRKGARFYVKDKIMKILVGKEPDTVGFLDLSVLLALYQERIVAELARRFVKR